MFAPARFEELGDPHAAIGDAAHRLGTLPERVDRDGPAK